MSTDTYEYDDDDEEEDDDDDDMMEKLGLHDVDHAGLGGQLRVPSQTLSVEHNFRTSRFLIVNSRDRDIDQGETLFDFVVKLNSASLSPSESEVQKPGCCSDRNYRGLVSLFCKNAIFPLYDFLSYEIYLSLSDFSVSNVDGTSQALRKLNNILVPESSSLPSRTVFNPIVGQNQSRIEVNNLQSFSVKVSFPLSDPVEYMGNIDVYEVEKLYVRRQTKEPLNPLEGGAREETFLVLILVLRPTEKWKLVHVRDGQSVVRLRNVLLEDRDLDAVFDRIRSLTLRVGRVSVTEATLELPLRHPGLHGIVVEALEIQEADNASFYPLSLNKTQRNLVLNESMQYTLVMEVVTVEKRLMYSNT